MASTQRNYAELLTGFPAVSGWSRHVAAIIESIDDLQLLLPTLLDAVDALTPNSNGRSGILLFTPRDSGEDIWCYPQAKTIYYDRVHKFDPFISALSSGKTGCILLRDVAPATFETSAFYKGVYSRAGLKDEIVHGVVLGSTLVFVGRVSEELLSAAEIEAHRNASEVIQAAMLHVTKLLLTTYQGQGFEPGRKIDYALSHFGGDVLTQREQDVIHLILRGHNTESIANQLGISPNTIKRHRSHAYKKLRVSSHGELFSRFLTMLGMGPSL